MILIVILTDFDWFCQWLLDVFWDFLRAFLAQEMASSAVRRATEELRARPLWLLVRKPYIRKRHETIFTDHTCISWHSRTCEYCASQSETRCLMWQLVCILFVLNLQRLGDSILWPRLSVKSRVPRRWRLLPYVTLQIGGHWSYSEGIMHKLCTFLHLLWFDSSSFLSKSHHWHQGQLSPPSSAWPQITQLEKSEIHTACIRVLRCFFVRCKEHDLPSLLQSLSFTSRVYRFI